MPLADLDLPGGNVSLAKGSACAVRKPADITLVRSRIFYSKPSLTTNGRIQAGYKHIRKFCENVRSLKTLTAIDMLNRYRKFPDPVDLNMERQYITKIMMYIFPRQFGLHNVFTSQVDPTKTSQKFQDYTLREEEIAPAFHIKPGDTVIRMPKIPKRLRGEVEHLVKRLQILHSRCSYTELLKHYCPCVFDRSPRSQRLRTRKIPTSSRKPRTSQHPFPRSNYKGASSQVYPEIGNSSTQIQSLPKHDSLVELATPSSHVSSFCQAVLSKVIPDSFWGADTTKRHNKSTVMRSVDHFVRLRRFEAMSLHEIAQGLKVSINKTFTRKIN